MPHNFGRPVGESTVLASFLDEANRLRAFVPPFRFTSFFSPEDTLLCTCAGEAALARARTLRSANGRSADPLRIAELTTGSGLVGLYLLRFESGSSLTGLDVDPLAVATARENAQTLGLSDRAHFDCADLWSDATATMLGRYEPHLLICNPPYVPEPPGRGLEREAGAGPDGTAHLIRALELAERLNPRALALSWCSLSDPVRVVQQAQTSGYALNSLFVVAIADGEYSGSVHDYLKSLPNAYINESDEVLACVAPDGAASFAYLLMAGDFSRTNTKRDDASLVREICSDFASNGLSSLPRATASIPVRTWLLDRWDELRLRAFLHGDGSYITA